MRNAWALVAVLAMAASFGGCNCPGTQPGEDAGPNGGNTDGGGDPDGGDPDGGVEPDAGPGGKDCALEGASCNAGLPCCLGGCDQSGLCSNTVKGCGDPGEACTDNNDCCTNRCTAGACNPLRCESRGDACAENSDCCSANCTGNLCGPIVGTSGTSCRPIGEACAVPTDCCSTNCKNGFCELQHPGFPCRATGDLCFGALDCCSNLCSKNDGTAGSCIAPSGGCTQDGLPCTGNSNCCTRLCADPGSGVKVCLPSSGCRMTGNSCTDPQACCGGGSNPNGSVNCVKSVSTDAYGRCDNGTSCNPVGNICGASFTLADGGTFSVNASQNCCEGKKEVCKLDSSGIPRCFGGGSTVCPNGYTGVPPCCIDEGQLCQFKDQCCDGLPCVPDPMGILRCTKSTCVPLGSVCTPGAAPGCCVGDCLPAGEFGHTCQNDGGCTDKVNGQACTAASECCSKICKNGVCSPDDCQGTGDVCTSNADCCATLSCNIPAGSTSGTCQPGSGCSSTGQSCSSGSPCCTGLTCLKANTNQLCDDTTACVCNVIIG